MKTGRFLSAQGGLSAAIAIASLRMAPLLFEYLAYGFSVLPVGSTTC
jgi:hypothetical protein